MRLKAIVLFLALAPVLSGAEAFWVSPQGNDSNPGTQDKPFATINHALPRLKPGSTLNVLPGDKPWPGDIRITVNGTARAPIIVDGHGSIVSGRSELPAHAWTAEGKDVYSRKLPNNAWGMEKHWEGGFPLAWFDGKPGRNVTSREELTPGSYFLHKNRKEQNTDPLHNTLYIRLKPGQTPANAKIQSITGEGGIYVGGNHVTVRNFITEYGGRDGFATHRNKGVVFENIEARHFMDQGMSHHGAEVTVLKAHFHHNAGAGVVDVYPECKTRYENCLIELDTWRGGVEFHSGEYEMINCIIRANPKRALTVTQGALVTLRDCVLIGADGGKSEGVNVGHASRLTMQNCALVGFRSGLTASLDASTRINMSDCLFLRCGGVLRLNLRQGRGDEAPDLMKQFTATGLECDGGTFEINSRMETKDKKWQSKNVRFKADEKAAIAEHFGAKIRFLSGREHLVGRYQSKWPFDRLYEWLFSKRLKSPGVKAR